MIKHVYLCIYVYMYVYIYIILIYKLYMCPSHFTLFSFFVPHITEFIVKRTYFYMGRYYVCTVADHQKVLRSFSC